MRAKKEIEIRAPAIMTAEIDIRGTAPLMTARFSKKAEIMAKMAEGVRNKTKSKAARDYDREAEEASYISHEGWYGINAAAFRNATISACRLVGFTMTLAKLSIFIKPDGYDMHEGTPLVRVEGERIVSTMHTRNANGSVDVRARPMWLPGWTATLRINYDADQFRAEDVANLVARVGMQVGVGEGRPDSKSSAGLGYGLFELVA